MNQSSKQFSGRRDVRISSIAGEVVEIRTRDGSLVTIKNLCPGFLVWVRDARGAMRDTIFSTREEIQSFLLDLITRDLLLSDFWNGQTTFHFQNK